MGKGGSHTFGTTNDLEVLAKIEKRRKKGKRAMNESSSIENVENATLNTLRAQLTDLNQTLVMLQASYDFKVDVNTNFKDSMRLIGLSVYKPITIK